MNTKNHPIKILSVVPYVIFPAVMGGQRAIAFLNKYISQTASFSCLTLKKNISNEPYEVLNELSSGLIRYIDPFLFFKIKRITKQRKITYILFEHPYFAWLIFFLSKFSSLHIIIRSHNIECERFKSIGKWWWRLLYTYEGFAYRHSDMVWFITEEDKRYATEHFGVDVLKSVAIPYGVENNILPFLLDLNAAKLKLQNMYLISKNETIILFNGTLSYKPNLDALKSIIHQINPILKESGLKYKILVCGKGLPDEMNQLKEYQSSNIIYCGFVDDIDLYFKGCDLFLNPLQDGGGIKTKLVEALGFGKKCVSSVNGAIGVDENCCGGRLKIVADKDWNAYAEAVVEMNSKIIDNDHSAFYEIYSWPKIAEKAMLSLT